MYRDATARWTLFTSCTIVSLVALTATDKDARAADVESWRRRIVRSFEHTNARIHQKGDRGTGLILAVMYPIEATRQVGSAPHWKLHVGRVGDLQAMVQMPGQTRPTKVFEGPDPNIYRHNLGLHPELRVEHRALELHPGQLVLLCSDGLMPKALNRMDIGRVLGALKTSVDIKARQLVGEALDRQRAMSDSSIQYRYAKKCLDPDNVSVWLAQVPTAPDAALAVFGFSDQGLGRPHHQDAIRYTTKGPPYVGALADGMSKLLPEGEFAPLGGDAANMAVTLPLRRLLGVEDLTAPRLGVMFHPAQ